MKLTSVALMVFFLVCIAWVPRGNCGSTQTIENSSSQEVVDAMANKAVRGIANVATGWLEIPNQIYQTYKEDGAVKGAAVGSFKGIGMTLVRTVAGVCETATFFIAFPGFFDPYVEPAYVWQDMGVGKQK